MIKSMSAIAATFCLVLPITSFAGTKYELSVRVTDSYIAGSMGAARNSSDNFQAIHVNISNSVATVWARDSSGTVKTCSTSEPSAVDTLRFAVGDSYVYTQMSSGRCLNPSIVNGSVHAPKAL